MLFTDKEKEALRQSGHSNADIYFILSALKKTRYALIEANGDRKDISEDEAIRRLGREEWVKGVARSAFYITTTRFGINGERIAMHSKTYDK